MAIETQKRTFKKMAKSLIYSALANLRGERGRFWIKRTETVRNRNYFIPNPFRHLFVYFSFCQFLLIAASGGAGGYSILYI